MLPNDGNSHDELKAEIEVKKMLLEVEHGANFFDIGKDIPPEIEKEWLENIAKFEEMHGRAEKIPLYTFLGKPDFQKVDEIASTEIESELNRLIEILVKNGIWLDVLAEYENVDFLIYKFITEELFLQEIENISIPGFNLHFIYEEFHPNHTYDITRSTNEIIRYIFNEKHPGEKRFDEFLFDVGDFIEVEVEDRDYKQKISPALTHFFNSFPKRELIEFEIPKIECNLLDTEDESASGNATAFVCLQYAAITESHEKINFTGTGKIYFEMQWSYWQIVKIELPGLTMG